MADLNEVNNAQPIRPVSRTMSQYEEYNRSLAIQTPATGFKEFTPRDSATQAKYDAMQDTWQGVESSDKAIASGAYKLDYASDDRSSKSIKQPPAPKDEWFCVVQ
jgi:hypothetical protein